jgi:ubiquinone/menaquinone biosynthesis C-methylase UbiE
MKKVRETHNKYQRQIFAKEVNDFCAPILEEVQRRLEQIVAKAELAKGERVLDVGTGTGVLIPYIRNYGIEYIVGCDLSPAMLTKARQCHRTATFWHGDVVDLPAELGPFDAVFLNAMFGNVWDQQETLNRVTELLNKAGRICISHPLGARYVAELNRTDPRRTPHRLPGRDTLLEMVRRLPIELIYYKDDPVLYLAVLRTV